MNRQIHYGIFSASPSVTDEEWRRLQQLLHRFQRLYRWEQDRITLDRHVLQASINVGANELNARAVISCVRDASEAVTAETWYCMDDGPALYCPLLLDSGLAQPDYQRMRSAFDSDARELPPAQYQYYGRLLWMEPDWAPVERYLRPLKIEEETNPEPSDRGCRVGVRSLNRLIGVIGDIVAQRYDSPHQYYTDVTAFPNDPGHPGNNHALQTTQYTEGETNGQQSRARTAAQRIDD